MPWKPLSMPATLATAIPAGDCPMGGVQESWGDPVSFFELILPPRAAKAAVPSLAVVAVAGIVGLVLRQPGLKVPSPGDDTSPD